LHHASRALAKASSSKTGRMAARTGAIAQCLDLEHEIYHQGSKPRILGFEPLK
jgi:hypothetical protein